MSDKKLNYTKKDFCSDISPKWCAGCGDHATFNALMTTFAGLDIPRENFLVVSGIGCSSRFPYYVESYGFHTIHGRAPTVALGAKLVNPDLSVWITTGDGDALSIGGNHFLHLMRRNANVNIIVFNNEIYGLTKGQASPTSRMNTKTKTTPFGSIDIPIQPLTVALAGGATFVARVIDTDPKLMRDVFAKAAAHDGVSVIEVLTNCVIFNKGVFDEYENKKTRADRTVYLKDGEALTYGENNDKGIVFENLEPKAVELGPHCSQYDLLIHKLGNENTTTAHMLSQIPFGGELPLPLGIFYQFQKPTYGDKMREQEEDVKEKYGSIDFNTLLKSGDVWRVDEDGTSHTL